MKNIKKSDMMKRYLIKFAIRILIFMLVFGLYITKKPLFWNFMTKPVVKGIAPIHALWLIFMLMMLRHLFPAQKLSMALRKSEKQQFVQQENYSELELYRYVQDQNTKAWKVMLIWLSANAVFGLLYLLDVIDSADLLMLTVFYFLCDYICILLFCPFQSFIMKNKCCVNCRIYDWGHFMMFTPMLFIQNFFSWSLFFMALIVLIHWEITYAKHPERFWSGSHQKLQCAHCNDKICKLKYVVKTK